MSAPTDPRGYDVSSLAGLGGGGGFFWGHHSVEPWTGQGRASLGCPPRGRLTRTARPRRQQSRGRAGAGFPRMAGAQARSAASAVSASTSNVSSRSALAAVR